MRPRVNLVRRARTHSRRNSIARSFIRAIRVVARNEIAPYLLAAAGFRSASSTTAAADVGRIARRGSHARGSVAVLNQPLAGWSERRTGGERPREWKRMGRLAPAR